METTVHDDYLERYRMETTVHDDYLERYRLVHYYYYSLN